LIEVAARALGVSQCLLLHTGGEMGKRAEECADHLRDGAKRIEAKPEPFQDDDRMPEGMWRRIAAFAEGVEDDHLVFDLTPGTKLMTLCLEQLARRFRSNAWMIYLRHTLKQGRPAPFSEYLERWRAGSEGGPFATFPGESIPASQGVE
jgi:hypothetical protein